MTDMNVHFSSATDLHATPQDFFDGYNKRFQFTLDVCAIAENAKCKRFFSPEDDGLKQDWVDEHGAPAVCWMNPPYGRAIKEWMRKAVHEWKWGATVVALVPSRTDTAWWHDYAAQATKIEFIRGRLKFGDAKNSAPFPSAVLIYTHDA